MKPKKRKNRQYANVLTPYLFILPNLLIFTCFVVVPMIFGIFYSLTKWNGLGPMKFVGFSNFVKIFSDPDFYAVMFNTFRYTVIVVPLIFFTALIIANMLIKEIKCKGFFRAAIYWPTMVSMILVGVTWKWIFGDDFGILNYILSSLGLHPVHWLTDSFFAQITVIVASIWNKIGFYMIIFMAGLQSIPTSYYEASDMDGATGFQKFRFITFPLLKPTSFLVFTLSIIDAFKAYGIIYTLTGGGPNGSTTYIVQTIYERAFFKQQLGYASAISTVLFVLLGGLTIIQFKANNGGEVK